MMNLKRKKSLIFLCIGLILLNWVFSFFPFQLDLTEDKRYNTSRYTKALLRDSLNDKIYRLRYVIPKESSIKNEGSNITI